MGLSWWLSSKEYASQTRNTGSFPRLGRSPGEGNGSPLQYSCLGNPMDREAWRATVHGVSRVGHNLVTKQERNNVQCSHKAGHRACRHLPNWITVKNRGTVSRVHIRFLPWRWKMISLKMSAALVHKKILKVTPEIINFSRHVTTSQKNLNSSYTNTNINYIQQCKVHNAQWNSQCQSKILRHPKKQEDMTHKEEIIPLGRTNPELTSMLELSKRNTKTIKLYSMYSKGM